MNTLLLASGLIRLVACVAAFALLARSRERRLIALCLVTLLLLAQDVLAIGTRGTLGSVGLDAIGLALSAVLAATVHFGYRRQRPSALGSMRLVSALMKHFPGAVYSYVRCGETRESILAEGAFEEILGPETAARVRHDVDAFRALVHPDDWQRYADAGEWSSATLEPFDVEYRVRTDDGHRWVRSISQPVRLGEDTIAWHGVMLDSSRMHESERRFQHLVDRLGMVVWEFDTTQHRFTWVSDQATAMLGYPIEAWYEPGFWLDHVHPDDRARVMAETIVDAGAERDGEYEYRFVAADGTPVWVRDLTRRDPRDRRTGRIRGVFLGIGRLRSAELQLEQSRERFRQIVEASQDTIWEADRDGRYTYVSPRVADVLGFAPGDLVGRSYLEFVAPRDRDHVRGFIEPIMRRRAAFTDAAVVHLDATGREVEMESSGSPFFDDDGAFLGYRGLLRDVSRRRRHERELEQRSAQLGRLLRELDHRVRNNLAALHGLVELSRRHATSVDHLAASVSDRVQTMARVHALLSRQDQPLRLGALALHLAPKGPGRLDVFGPDPAIPSRQAPAVALVLHELLANALRHGALSVDGGRVALWIDQVTATEEQRRVVLRWVESGGPPIEVVGAPGVGTALIEGLTRSELMGQAQLAYPSGGVEHHLTIHLDAIATSDSTRAEAPSRRRGSPLALAG